MINKQNGFWAVLGTSLVLIVLPLSHLWQEVNGMYNPDWIHHLWVYSFTSKFFAQHGILPAAISGQELVFFRGMFFMDLFWQTSLGFWGALPVPIFLSEFWRRSLWGPNFF